jgi:O-antigen ligase
MGWEERLDMWGVLEESVRMRLVWHRYLEPGLVEHDLGSAAAKDPFGDRVHLWLGAAWCFLVSWPTSVVEIAAIPLVVFFVLRAPKIWRTWGSFAMQPLMLAIGAWVLWQGATLFWTADLRQGLKELSANRWVWVIWVLWPLMSRRRVLIWALAAGFVCGNLAQLGHAVGRAWEVSWLVWPRLENRNSGWWDPVVGGSLLVGALGLHLPAAVMGRGWERLVGLAGAVVMVVAIFATGTRGAWIAAGVLIAAAVVIGVGSWVIGRSGRSEPRTLRGVLAVSVLVVAMVAGAFVVGDTVAARYRQGWEEVVGALERGDYSTDTGKRLLMWRVAAEAAAARPVRGVGAGGYKRWGDEHLAARGEVEQAGVDGLHAHAHSALPHIAATTGLVGLGLAAVVIGLALYGGFTQLGAGLGTYAAGPGFAAVGLLLVSAFDPVHLNAQTGALLATVMALCLVSRPREGPICSAG